MHGDGDVMKARQGRSMINQSDCDAGIAAAEARTTGRELWRDLVKSRFTSQLMCHLPHDFAVHAVVSSLR